MEFLSRRNHSAVAAPGSPLTRESRQTVELMCEAEAPTHQIRLCNNVKIENRSSVIYWGVIHFQYTTQYQFVDFWTQSVIYSVVIHDIFFRIK